jgi:RimJ/RimL family protein N-acetyltransferase
MIEGTDVRLRPWRNEDLAMLTELRNDILVQAQLLARPRGSRPEEVLSWLQSQNEQMNRLCGGPGGLDSHRGGIS